MRTVNSDSSGTEAWRNASRGKAAVLKFDKRGDLRHEIVASGRVINLTPEERKVNQEMAASDSLDLFANGTLVPVRLIAEDEDYERITSNPNLLSEGDMAEILKLHWKKFDAAIEEISNPGTIERLLELASADENVSHRVVTTLSDKLAELNGGVRVVEREVVAGPQVVSTQAKTA